MSKRRPATSGHNLPPEIIEAILPLLPPKSLGRFKSVSKTWNSLISDPHFIKTHLLLNIHQHQTTKLVLVSSDTNSLYSLDTSQLFQCLNSSNDIPVTGKELNFRSPGVGWKETFGSCNGLVLAKDKNHTIFLMSPATHELLQIPLCPFEGDICVGYGVCYDSSTDDYKVLSISFWHPFRQPYIEENIEEDPYMQVSVYSLRHNSWTKLPTSPYDIVHLNVFSNGIINQNFSFHWSASPSTAVAFSLESGEFSEVNLPNNNKDWSPYFLLHLDGKLGVLVATRARKGYELWVMEEGSWTMVCYIGIEKKKHPIKSLCLVEGGKQIVVLGDDDGEVFVYNVDERRCRNVRMVDGPSRFRIGGTYVETLESPRRVHNTTLTP